MQLDTALELCRDSDAEAWHLNDLEYRVDTGHHSQAAYIADVSLTIEWGQVVQEEFQAEWAKAWPDESARGHIAEVFYNGALIFQQHYVTVDGGRCSLPSPDRVFDRTDPIHPKITGWQVTEWEVSFMFLLHDISRSMEDFNQYMAQSGFSVVSRHPLARKN